MSKLASKIAATPPPTDQRVRRGPANECYPRYGEGDLEDWEAMEALRLTHGLQWKQVQAHIDSLLGVEKPLRLDQFKHHWRRFCWCWPDDLRRGR